jgi:hypothetical protein
MTRGIPIAALVLLSSALAGAEELQVDPNVGNSTFTAVFDAALGERITANSSAVACDLTFDDKTNTASGSCSVPLKSIRVDNDDTKTEHFQQWSTNKKMDAKDCRFEAKLDGVRLNQPLQPEKPVQFSAEVPFKICGKARSDGGKERVTGAAILFPAGSYGTAKTIRIRARIDGFTRDRYQIGPKYTSGWLSRVQSLAKVVAEEGTIELNLFAKSKSAPTAGR